MSQLWGMSKTPTTAVKFRVVGKIRAFCFLPSLIDASRAALCGTPLEMTEGTTSGARVQSAFKADSAEWAPQPRPLPLSTWGISDVDLRISDYTEILVGLRMID
jgi:hypothetical protein